MAMLLCFAFQANAQVAKIGETAYSTFGDALTAAGEMSGDVTVEVYDKVTLNTAFSGSYSSINFVGKDTAAEIYLDVQGYITATGKKVSFKDLTLSKSQGGFITNAGFMNVAFGVYDVVEVVYTNCVFANGAYASSGNVTYTDCTFKMSWDKYGLWAYGDVDVTVDGCVFDNYRGIKMYAEGKAKTTELTVKNTDFSALDGKPAIVLTYGASVVLENNTYSSTGTLELDLDGDPNGTAVTSDVAPVCVNDNGACGVLVDGKIYATVAQAAAVATEGSNVTLLYSTDEVVEFAEGVNLTLANGVTADNVTVIVAGLTGEGTAASPFLINNVDDLVWFQKKVDELAADGSTQFAGKYFKLTADINLAGINWNPIGSMSGDHGSFKGVFDGDNHTISNLNVEQSGNGIGLFARTTGNAVIKNLKLNNVIVKSTDNSNYVGGVVGNAYASTKIENVHLSGNIYISGRGYIGGIAGHGYVVMDNVSVVATGDGQGNDKGLVTSTFWCAGGILGYGGEGATNIMNANVENVVVTSAAGGLGAIVGMAEDNNGTQPISGSNLSASNVEIKTYTGDYGDGYANYALGYLYGGNPTSKLTGEIKVENVDITTSNGVAPSVNDAVASIDGTIYFSLASAVVAADGKTITLLRDVELTETLTIPADKTIALDLNGKTVSMADASGATAALIKNNGNLTITDGTEGKAGKLTFNSTTPSANNGYACNTISNYGTITIEAGTIENTTVGGACYALDNYAGSTATINGGKLTAEKTAVRIFNWTNGDAAKATLNVNGGKIYSKDGYAINVNSGNAPAVALNITGGTITTDDTDYNLAVYVYVANTGTAENFTASVTGGTFNGYYALNGITSTTMAKGAVSITDGTFDGVICYDEPAYGFISGGTYAQDVNEYCAEGFACEQNADGTYGIVEAEVVVAKIGDVEYTSLQAAVDAATTGQTIILLADVELTETLTIPADKTVALDLNGKTISQTKEQTAGYQMILNDGNLTIDDSSESKAGKISYTDSGNGGEYISDVIYNRSVLVINGGTIENLSSATVASNGYPHAVDTYSGIRDTYVEINGGTIYCAEYSAMRMFCVSATNKADLVINGGTIKGAIDMQNGTKVAALGTLTINDGTFETTKNANNIRFANWNGGATEYGVSAEIKGGSFNGGITTAYVPAAANWDKGIISGGTYAQDMTDYCADGFACEQNADGTYGIVEAEVVVAKIGEVEYETLAAALAAAKDGETVTLLWAEGDPAIAMNGAVFGKNVTIAGTATVDWSKGWFYVGRGGAGNATVTFDGANLTSASANENSGLGIHVSGREKDTNNKYDGTLVIKNSTIALDYLINRGAIELGEGAVLTVKNGFGIAGRPASETENGEAATATVTLNNGSKLVVNNHNGMGLGQAATNPEGYGIMNVNEGATFEATQNFLVTANGTMNVAAGGAVNVNGTLTVNGTLVCAGNIAATIAAGDAANIEISGGVYTQNVAEWCIDGYAALPDLNGNYVVGEEPTATVNNLGAMTIPGGEYSIYDGSYKETTATDPGMPLSFVMQFLADQDADDMTTSPYADWYGDFVLTFTGLEGDSFSAEGCYLAGYYGSFGWVKVPVDGLLSTIEEGVRYPVMLGVGLGQKYDYICTGVKDFRCALYIPETVLEANPNIEVKLELSVVDNSKGQDASAEALVNGTNIYEVGAYEYEAKDFNPGYLREYTINDVDALDYTQAEDKIIGTLTYNRTLIEGIWNPLYLPFSVSLKNLADNYEVAYYNTMHSYDNDNNGTFETFEMEVLKLTANELNDVMLRANYPYFIRPKNADACALQIVETDATLFAAAEKVITTTSVSHTFQLKSTHKALDEAALTGCYAISVDGDWALTAGLKPHRLYLTISANDDSPYATTAAKTIRIVARGDEGFEGTTGVDIVETDTAADGTIYDLSGRPVEEPVKGGMYIINGKKVIY